MAPPHDNSKSALQVLPADRRQVLVLMNPRAGGHSRQPIVDELCQNLLTRSLSPQVFQDIDPLVEAAERLQSAGQLRAVVAAGGDGTFRLVAERTPLQTPLSIFPLGTENLVAKYLDAAPDPWQAARTLADGLTVPLDAGLADGRLFSLMAGCGFDADVVRRLHRTRRGHIRHWSYAKPILDTIRNYDYPELRIYYSPADDDGGELTREISARWAFVINLPRYAGGLSFAPRASATDGLFDLCTFKEGSLWHGLIYLGGVILGQHESMQDFNQIKTRKLRIECVGNAPYQLDGDPGGELPVEIQTLPGRLLTLVSRSWATRNGMLTDEKPQEHGS
jgi:diacylglycerol kinase family enzyme